MVIGLGAGYKPGERDPAVALSDRTALGGPMEFEQGHLVDPLYSATEVGGLAA